MTVGQGLVGYMLKVSQLGAGRGKEGFSLEKELALPRTCMTLDFYLQYCERMDFYPVHDHLLNSRKKNQSS